MKTEIEIIKQIKHFEFNLKARDYLEEDEWIIKHKIHVLKWVLNKRKSIFCKTPIKGKENE